MKQRHGNNTATPPSTGETEADIRHYVEQQYRSEVLTDEQHARFMPRLRELVLAIQPTSRADARNLLGAGAALVADNDLGDSTVDELMTEATVVYWTGRLLTEERLTTGTVKNYIGRFQRLLRVTRDVPGRIRVQASKQTPAQGYSDETLDALATAVAAAGVHATRGLAASVGLGHLGVESGTFVLDDGNWFLHQRNGSRTRVLPFVGRLAETWGDATVRDGDVDAFRVVARDLGVNVTAPILNNTFRRLAFELPMPVAEVLGVFNISVQSIDAVRHSMNAVELMTPELVESMRGLPVAACAPHEAAHVAARPPSSGSSKDTPVKQRKKKISRQEVQRLAAEHAALLAQPVSLAEELRPLVEHYVPPFLTSEEWAAVRPMFVSVMSRCAHLKNKVTLERHRAPVAGLLAWALGQHLSFEEQSILTYRTIDAYWASGLVGMQDRTRNDYRSRLRNIAKRVNPSIDSPISASTGYRSVRPGYSAAEEASITRIVKWQRRPELRRKACLVVGLSAGGGLDAKDMRDLFTESISDFGDSGILVQIGGKNPRTVVIRRAYEELVRIGLEGLQPGEQVFRYDGRDVENPVGRMLEDLETSKEVPSILVSRLRTTWLTWLTGQPVPVQVILQVAGLKSARTLTDLLTHLPPADGDIDFLRDGSDK